MWASWVVEQILPDSPKGASLTSIYSAGDTGHMTPSGPCPVFEEIGSKYGPFDIVMLLFWRDGSLNFVARLGFRRHSLAIHFATFASSDTEALDPIVGLERSKREMVAAGGDAVAVAAAVGYWWMDGGMGAIYVGETAIVCVVIRAPLRAWLGLDVLSTRGIDGVNWGDCLDLSGSV
ncbi:hypothetical protein EI94DRAFT_1705439 [Lactarius quietus]|nr:hypothetical protein EI94DRAFT_1705439 [Lactarius quietus]